MRIAREDAFAPNDPVIDELLHLYMDFQLRHQALLQEASLAADPGPSVEAATGVAMCIVRVMSSLNARGYEFPD